MKAFGIASLFSLIQVGFNSAIYKVLGDFSTFGLSGLVGWTLINLPCLTLHYYVYSRCWHDHREAFIDTFALAFTMILLATMFGVFFVSGAPEHVARKTFALQLWMSLFSGFSLFREARKAGWPDSRPA